MMRRFLKSTVFAILLAVPCLRADGQDTPRYRPQRPTVSPYLNLLRNDNGPVPNYYSLVRPQLNQQAFDNRIASAARLQSLSIQKLEDIAERGATGPTGTGSVYRNLSHFYPAKQATSPYRRQ